MGSTCTCGPKGEELEEWQLNQDEINAHKSQPKDDTNQEQEAVEQHHDDTPTEELDPIQLESYNPQQNSPDIGYAIPLTIEEEEQLLAAYPTVVKDTLQRLKKLQIKAILSKNYLKIPKLETSYRLPQMEVYVGQWAKGKPFGIGTIYFQDYSVYEGQVVDGLPNGEGRKVFSDGSVYNGQFNMGDISGNGELKKIDRFHYKGQWLNGKPDGNGLEEWPDKTTYQGQYKGGRKHGKGTFTWGSKINKKTGIIENYVGEFKDDLFHGEGRYEWQDGRTYEGQWEEGKMQGEGVFLWPDKRKYTGAYYQDYKTGMGTLEWPDGKKLTGTWKLGKMHGLGTLTYNNKEYKGEWADGKRLRWLQETQPSIVNSAVSLRNDEHTNQLQSQVLLVQDKQQTKHE